MINNIVIDIRSITTLLIITFIIVITHYCLKSNRLLDLKKTKGGKRVVVSLTSSPTRITLIKDTLDSIMKQTIKPDLIYLNLPFVFKRTNKKFKYPLPSFITSNTLIVVNQCKDIGPATKVLPVLEHEQKNETVIISIDDDITYNPLLIETLLSRSNEFPNSVITTSSFVIDDIRQKKNERHDVTYVQLLEGFSGVLYKVKFIKNFDISILSKTIVECFRSDDVMLSNHVLSEGYSIIKTNKILGTPLDYGLKEDALHNLQIKNKPLMDEVAIHSINYTKCANWLDKKGLLSIKLKDNKFKNY
ncbi:hypothetical protein CCP3SC1AL1_990007 [Gammaproteobacteria bacterium]